YCWNGHTHTSISTSPFSIFSEYTAIFTLGFCDASPVFGSHAQPCQGHTTLPPSIIPCPSGPPRCMQTLSMALKVPFTLATQMVFSPQGNSLASSAGGSSDSVVSFVKFGMGISNWQLAVSSDRFAKC